MIGLTWGDPSLTLSPAQWAAMIGACAAWCARPKVSTAWLTCPLLFCAFWNVPLGRDSALLFEQSAELQGRAWGAFLAQFWREPYLEYQTPFFPFIVSRLPVFWVHQAALLPSVIFAIMALFRLDGARAALVCATPLFSVMITQPSTDIYLFILLLASLLAIQQRRMMTAAVLYGASWLIKPLVLMTLPIMAVRLGAWVGISLLCWGGYALSVQFWPFGAHQNLFLLRQLLLLPGKPSARPGWQLRSATWRWRNSGRQALTALPVWMFPAWLFPCSLTAVILAAVIIVGCGNIKYLLLIAPFVLRVQS